MSRMGKIPVALPEGVNANIDGNILKIEGPKNRAISQKIHPLVKVEIKGKEIWVRRENNEKDSKALQGLTHRLISNMVKGVMEGFKKVLEIVGVGYRAEISDRTLLLSLGFSHPVRYKIPDGVEVRVEKATTITISGINKQKVGQVASEIRSIKPPDAYKGKGIRYQGETVRIKPGKASVGKGF